MKSRDIWEINEGFETFSPNTKEYLFIEVEAPDFILTYTLGHAKSEMDFEKLGIDIKDFDGTYNEGEHVFVVNFVMQNSYSERPSKNIKLSAPAYIDMVEGAPYHILVMVDKTKKERRRSRELLLTDQV